MRLAKARTDDDPEAAADRAETGGGDAGPVLQLSAFEGPLDLLLHLIQKHELDILDIPVSFITQKYLDYLGQMRTLSIDVASEYLVMAATLAHIKSKMLLPSVPSDQDDDGALDEEDPRAELVRRLLEYQKYKAAAADLGDRAMLGRDVFVRGEPEPVPDGPAPFAPVGVFALLDAFDRVLERAHVRVDHEVVFDRISITDRILQLTELLGERRALSFEELLLARVPPAPGESPDTRAPTRSELVLTFLALLEMCRLKLVRVYQSDALAPIHVEMAFLSGSASGPSTDLSASSSAPSTDNLADVGQERSAEPARDEVLDDE